MERAAANVQGSQVGLRVVSLQTFPQLGVAGEQVLPEGRRQHPHLPLHVAELHPHLCQLDLRRGSVTAEGPLMSKLRSDYANMRLRGESKHIINEASDALRTSTLSYSFRVCVEVEWCKLGGCS